MIRVDSFLVGDLGPAGEADLLHLEGHFVHDPFPQGCSQDLGPPPSSGGASVFRFEGNVSGHPIRIEPS